MEQGLTQLETLVAEQGVNPELLRKSWESGRLALHPGYRGGPELIKRCICLGVQYLSSHTDARNVFGSCTPVLARLYCRYGFAPIGTVAPAGASGTFSLIHATVENLLVASGDAYEERGRFGSWQQGGA